MTEKSCTELHNSITANLIRIQTRLNMAEDDAELTAIKEAAAALMSVAVKTKFTALAGLRREPVLIK